jgi:hypothetical protein
MQPAGWLLCCAAVTTAVLAFFTAVFGVRLVFVERLLAQVKLWQIILVFIIVIAAGWTVTLARALAGR